MKAYILIGGKGERMRPMTDFCPKEMFPMISRPFLDLIVEDLEEAGFKDKDIVFILSASKKSIIDYYNSHKRWFSYFFDSGSGLGNAIIEAHKVYDDGEPFIVMLGDMLVYGHGNIVKDMIDQYNKTNEDVVGAFVNDYTFYKYCAIIEDGERVISFKEKPKTRVSTISCSGQYLFKPEFVNHLKKYTKMGEGYGFTEAMTSYAQDSMNVGFAFNPSSILLDVGTPDAYAKSIIGLYGQVTG